MLEVGDARGCLPATLWRSSELRGRDDFSLMDLQLQSHVFAVLEHCTAPHSSRLLHGRYWWHEHTILLISGRRCSHHSTLLAAVQMETTSKSQWRRNGPATTGASSIPHRTHARSLDRWIYSSLGLWLGGRLIRTEAHSQ
jgi:hypothetical protein